MSDFWVFGYKETAEFKKLISFGSPKKKKSYQMKIQ